MANVNNVECIIKIGYGPSEILENDSKSRLMRVCARFKGLYIRLVMRVWMFMKMAWAIGLDDRRKVFHCLKVGVSLTVVSLFYYIRPLYDGFGGNALWAIMTVVVVFEYTVGGTLYKCVNRICATFLAGFLALGVYWVASQSGHRFEPVVMGVSLFIIASVITFSRFIPIVKSRYDYGCTIFMLTYSLVLISGYRVEKLVDESMQRISTIILGTALCIIISMLGCPVWAGMELHLLILSNMDNLANSLDSCVAEYFSNGDEDSKKTLLDYKCVLNSKASEESMAGFARWEPAHGHFSFRHPWNNYVKIGSSSRSCAYCIETLISCMETRNHQVKFIHYGYKQVPETIRNHFSSSCLKRSSCSSNVIRELSTTVSSMTHPAQIDIATNEMKKAVENLENDLKCLPDLLIQSHEEHHKKLELLEVIPLATFVSLLIELASRIEGGIVKSVEELADSAKFKKVTDEMELQKKTQDTSQIVDNTEKVIAHERV